MLPYFTELLTDLLTFPNARSLISEKVAIICILPTLICLTLEIIALLIAVSHEQIDIATSKVRPPSNQCFLPFFTGVLPNTRNKCNISNRFHSAQRTKYEKQRGSLRRTMSKPRSISCQFLEPVKCNVSFCLRCNDMLLSQLL